MKATSERLFVLGLLAVLGLMSACSTASRIGETAAGTTPGKGIYKVGKPYQVDGVWYYPHEDLGYDETGIGSWYGEAFHGRYTANGEVFDLSGLTAAHHTLPLPSIVEVTNLENGKSLKLRINDRGPFARGRIIDVSRHAAQLLGFERQGTAKVRVRVLTDETQLAQSNARRNGIEEEQRMPIEVAQASPRTAVDVQGLAPLPGQRAAPGAAANPSLVRASAIQPAPTPEPVLSGKVVNVGASPNTQIYVQAGAFAQIDNANRVKQRIGGLGQVGISAVRVNGADLYRVRLGPIASVDQADQLLAKVLAAGLGDAKIVVD